jgi:hypothetical protein
MTKKLSAADQVMKLLSKNEQEKISDDMLTQSINEGLASRFGFLIEPVYNSVAEYRAHTKIPEIYHISIKAQGIFPQPDISTVVARLIPEATAAGNGRWQLPATIDTPVKMAQMLADRGLIWDKHFQPGSVPQSVFQELETALKKETPPPSPQPGVSIETDPAKNKAADKVIDIIMNGPWLDESDDVEWGVPKALVKEAGKALANRHCFAISGNEGYGMTALITPIKHFEKEGACSDQSGPVDDLLPPRVGNASESEWEFYDPAVKTALDAAKSLQEYGFFWNRDFQEFIDSSLTKELSVLEKSAAKPTAAPKKPRSSVPRQ